MAFIYTDEHKKWLRINYPVLSESELRDNFFKVFGVYKQGRALNSYCRTVLHLQRSDRRGYTETEIKWLYDNYPCMGRTECANRFNSLFKHNKTPKTIEKYCHRRLGIHCSDDRLSRRYEDISKPLGYRYKNCRGEWKVKTDDGWIPLSHLYNNVPKGYIAFHLDGDLNNNEPDNIIVIRNGVQTTIRNYNMTSENADITRTAIAWCELYQLLKKEGIVYERN